MKWKDFKLERNPKSFKTSGRRIISKISPPMILLLTKIHMDRNNTMPISSKSSTIKWESVLIFFFKKSKIQTKNNLQKESKVDPSYHPLNFRFFHIPLLLKKKERKGVDIRWKKSLRLPSYTLPFSPSKLGTTIAELFLHGTFRNLGVGGNPSLRFIVKIVTSTRIFSSAGDNTVIIPPLDRWTDRQREFTLVRTQSGVVHFDLHRDFGPLPPSNRSSRNFIFDKYFHFDWTKETRGWSYLFVNSNCFTRETYFCWKGILEIKRNW